MRLLALSDLHEEEAALESLRRISSGYDFVFACGDIAQSAFFAEAFLEALPKSLIVPGNWDSPRANGILSSAPQWLHMKRTELGEGLNVVGFGYSNPTPFGTYGELSENEIYSSMKDLPIDHDTLLLLHCPPKGFFDERKGVHVGSESILRIISEKKPLAAFFGHIHEYAGTSMLGRTTLIKLPPANGMRACSLIISDKKVNAQIIDL